MKKALITGISGQDGALLARLLLQKGYEVHGTSRTADPAHFSRLKLLGVHDLVRILTVDIGDIDQATALFEREGYAEVYHLAGQSSVGQSFARPYETFVGTTASCLCLLEAVRRTGPQTRFYHAGSGEMFGPSERPLNEESPINPQSPYAAAKAASYLLMKQYRDAYRMHISTGILFNHESPLRPESFVVKKIVQGAAAIKMGRQRELRLGNIEIERDWGWAPEYVEAIWQMTQRDDPADLVIATGRTSSLKDILSIAFSSVGLRWQDHVRQDTSLLRPADLSRNSVDVSRAKRELGWHARVGLEEIVTRMMEFELTGRLNI